MQSLRHDGRPPGRESNAGPPGNDRRVLITEYQSDYMLIKSQTLMSHVPRHAVSYVLFFPLLAR